MKVDTYLKLPSNFNIFLTEMDNHYSHSTPILRYYSYTPTFIFPVTKSQFQGTGNDF